MLYLCQLLGFQSLKQRLTSRYVKPNGALGWRVRRKCFATDQNCEFCGKKGHMFRECPSLPSEPEVKIEFAQKLRGSPRICLKEYEGMSWSKVLQYVEERGKNLNKGNPWMDDKRPLAGLRKCLGTWKAIGASKSVLSRLAYGYQMRFFKEPGKAMFKNNVKSDKAVEDFVEQEKSKHVADGSFVEIGVNEVQVVNPFLVSVNAAGKMRRCDDMRFVNAFMPLNVFSMQTLARDVPNVVGVGYGMITRDLEKAYYKVPVSESSTKSQCFFWKGKFYKAFILLFVFCQAPFVFTRICKVIVKFCGVLLIPVINFIDDFLFSTEQAKLVELQTLGWTMSEKSNQIENTVKFLGFIIDSV